MAGFIDNLVSNIVSAAESTIFELIYNLLIKPMSDFVAAMMGFLQQLITSTPYPRQEAGSIIPAVMTRPDNAPWGFLYDLHSGLFQPYAYLLLFVILIVTLFADAISDFIDVDGIEGVSKTKSNLFTNFLLVTFWWYIGTLILAVSDALTQLLLSLTAQENNIDSVGLVAVWDATSQTLTGEGSTGSVNGADSYSESNQTPISSALMAPLIIIWMIETLIMLVLSIIWVIRMFAIFVLMPIMPLLLGFKALHISGFERIQSIGESSLSWFVNLAFVTLPAAIFIAVSGQITLDVISFGEETLLSGSGGGSGQESVEALDAYNTQQIISHAQIDGTVYGDGVAGLGASSQDSVAQLLAGLGAILLAIVLVIAIPLIAGFMPLLLYRSEIGGVAQGAVNPAAGVMESVSDARGKVNNTRTMANNIRNADSEAFLDEESAVSVEGDNLRDALTGDKLKTNLKHNQAGLLGLATTRSASETQERATQIRNGAETASAKVQSGLSTVDDFQRYATENPGEMMKIGGHNLREGMTRMVDPENQKDRARAIGNLPSDAGEAVSDMADSVAEAKYAMDDRINERKRKRQVARDTSTAELRQMYETEDYRMTDSQFKASLERDDTVLDASTHSGMLNEISQLQSIGKDASPTQASNTISAMRDTLQRGLQGTDYDSKHYTKFLTDLQDRVFRGDVSPEEAMRIVDETVKNDLETRVTTTEDKWNERNKKREMYEKYGVNASSEEEVNQLFQQSFSAEELKNLKTVEDILGGANIDKSKLKEALEKSGKDPSQYDLDDMAEKPHLALQEVGAETFNEVGVSDIEADPELGIVGGIDINKVKLKQALKESGKDPSQYDLDDMAEKPHLALQEIDTETFNELEVSKQFKADKEVDIEKGLEKSNFSEKELQQYNVNELIDSIDNEYESDIDTGKILNMYQDEDRVSLSSKNQQSFMQDIEQSIQSDTDESPIDLQALEGGIDTEKFDAESIQELDSDVLDSDEFQEELQEFAELLAKDKGTSHGKSLKEVQDVRRSVQKNVIEARESHKAQVLENIMENATSADAKIKALRSAAGQGPSQNTTSDEEIIGKLIEQEAAGEQIGSDISKQFHEEYDSTEEMLDNIGDIEKARDIVNKVESQDIDMEAVANEYQKGLESVTEDISKIERIQDIKDNPDSKSLEEINFELGFDDDDERQLSINTAEEDTDEEDTKTLEDLGVETQDVISEKVDEVEETIIDSVKSDIQEKYDVSPEEIDGIDEVTEENIDEFADKAAKKSLAKAVEEEL